MADLTLDGDTLTAIRQRLEGVSEAFAARRMQRALSAGMSGKSLAEIEAALADEGLDAKRGGHSAELVPTDDPET
jgi:molecular chaperone HscA